MTAAVTASEHLSGLASRDGVVAVRDAGPGGMPLVECDPAAAHSLLSFLRDEAGFEDLTLLTAQETLRGPAETPAADEADEVDEAGGPGVTMVWGLERRSDRAHVLVWCALDDSAPRIATVSDLWAGAAPLEREVFDLFGVRFTGHPGLTRIVLRDDFEGHPLRKSFTLPRDGVSPDEVARAVEGHGEQLARDGAPCAPPGFGAPEGGEPDPDVLVLNMGPQHPSMHGVLHLWLALEGERVIEARPTHGYLHRCIEKLCETVDHRACTALLDRCDYVSGFHTELAHMLALEELAGIEPTPKADHLRVAMCELVRITSHHTWFAAAGLDTGALTPFLYAFIDRELILDFFEEVTGARMMFNYLRPGGVKDDAQPDAVRRMLAYLRDFDRAVDEYEALLTGNEIFRLRTRGVGFLSRDAVRAHGVTGPMARASGVDIDLRRDEPYSAYEALAPRVALGETGDTFDRYTVRIAEMRDSARIALEALEGLPEGPHVSESVPRALKPPAGAAFRRVESPRGELGVYLVSDGTQHAWRLKVRSPAFSNLHSVGPLLEGLMVGDVVAVLGSVDVVMGEIDR